MSSEQAKVLNAHERMEKLFDPGTFQELDRHVRHHITDYGMAEKRPEGDGVVTGFGMVNGRQVFAYAQDKRVFGGSLGFAHAMKICKAMDMADRAGCPLVGFNDSGGARLQEGVVSLAGYGEIFHRNVNLSGRIPQISVISGVCAGGAVYSPALTDFIVMVRDQSLMFITGPKVVKAVTGQDVEPQKLGGAKVHATKSGVCQLMAKTDEQSIEYVRTLLGYLPQSFEEKPPVEDNDDPIDRLCPELESIVPEDTQMGYDVRKVIKEVMDKGEFFEVHGGWAKNIVVGFARMAGRTVGVVANQPMFMAGCLDVDASRKGARFVRTCDAYNIPIITFEDVPGYLPGMQQEYAGIIGHGAKMLYAYSEARVPKLTVILRKAFGGSYLVMSSKHMGSDFNIAWPKAQLAVMGAEGAVAILYRKQLMAIREQDGEQAEAEARERFLQEYRDVFMNPKKGAEHGYLDDVIDPAETRKVLCRALVMLDNKLDPRPEKLHGNEPL